MNSNNNNKDDEKCLEKLAYGFQTKECAKNYVIGRPSYPNESIDYIKSLGITNDSKIVDLAAGTGKFTEVLARNGFKNIIAVEPSKEFREQCEIVLSNFKNQNYKVIDGYSNSIPLPDNSVDCIVTAHAFHWFSNIESLTEISRVLKPNSPFIIIWNKADSDKNSNELLKNVIHLYKDPYYNSSSSSSNSNGDGRKSPTAILLENWKNVFDEIKSNENLHYIMGYEIKQFPNIEYIEKTNGERIISLSQSQSYISLLPNEKKKEFIDDLKINLEKYDQTKDGKIFSVIYKTEMYYTRKPALK